jgi:hypothetical protein
VKGGEGFGSTNPYRQHFGLGGAASIEFVEVFWPGARKQVIRNISADSLERVTEFPATRPNER